MRSYPADKYDRQDLERLAPEPWMVEILKMNPAYCSWGPHEDYMWKDKDGWDSRVLVDSWKTFGPWDLGDLNECVNFYFEISRPSVECEVCGGHGHHPDAQWVSESFYSHSSPFKKMTQGEIEAQAVLDSFGGKRATGVLPKASYPTEAVLGKYGPEFRVFCEQMRTRHFWNDNITEDEAEALVEAGRGYDNCKTASDFNARQKTRSLGHDGINSSILVQHRIKRFGLPQFCPRCEGHGHVFTAPAHLNLVLWMLHPRKGCSRGIEVSHITQAELPEIRKWLKSAAKRNARRFGKL